MRQPLTVRIADTIGTRLRFLPAAVLRPVYRVGHFFARIVWAIFEPEAHGAKVAVHRGDEILLVRLTYGRREEWDLPGGTLNDGETLVQTAARELREETGLEGEPRLVGSWGGPGRKGRGHLNGYAVEVPAGTEPAVDPAEIAEARWFARDALPASLSATALEIIEADR